MNIRQLCVLVLGGVLALSSRPAPAAEDPAYAAERRVHELRKEKRTKEALAYLDLAVKISPWRRENCVIDMPYGAGLLAEPNGRRFALLKDRTVHLYTFDGFKRLSKSSAPVLKDQSILAWTWIDGTDGVAVISSVVKAGAFGLGETKKTPHLLKLDVATGAGNKVPLEFPGGYLSASFDAKGERVAIGFSDGHVQVHCASDGGLMASCAGHSTPWNSPGLAFHPVQSRLASSDGQKLILFDLDANRVGGTHPTQDGAKLLGWVADGQFLIAGDTTTLSLLDPKGRRLETTSTDDSYGDFYVADPLRKVFTLRGDLVCWRTFERWGRVPFVARGASSGGAPLSLALGSIGAAARDALPSLEKLR